MPSTTLSKSPSPIHDPPTWPWTVVPSPQSHWLPHLFSNPLLTSGPLHWLFPQPGKFSVQIPPPNTTYSLTFLPSWLKGPFTDEALP